MPATIWSDRLVASNIDLVYVRYSRPWQSQTLLGMTMTNNENEYWLCLQALSNFQATSHVSEQDTGPLNQPPTRGEREEKEYRKTKTNCLNIFFKKLNFLFNFKGEKVHKVIN